MTEDRFTEAQDNNEGWCRRCKEWTHDSCEPDAQGYVCPECDRPTVYGADEALMMGLFTIDEEDEE